MLGMRVETAMMPTPNVLLTHDEILKLAVEVEQYQDLMLVAIREWEQKCNAAKEAGLCLHARDNCENVNISLYTKVTYNPTIELDIRLV